MKHLKQAVVLIHGISEHRPTETLRSFVEAVLPDTLKDSQTRYRSKPDRMAESFELRCLQAPSHRGTHRPITDFYEYYWAHHMQESKYGSGLSWLGCLLVRPFWQIPKNLRPIYFVTYAGLLLALLILCWGIFDQTGQSILARLFALYEKKQFYVAVAVLVVQAIGSRFFLHYVANAARYLTPTPDNIEARNKIRAEGIQLLRSLHESGKYFRIVIVGHGIGSVIGYDILRHLWVDFRESYSPSFVKQPLAEQFDIVAYNLQRSTMPVASNVIEKFQQQQHVLWREHRAAGIPWLVTDFITLGSPLSNAALLMADTIQCFEKRKIEFEFPCCPPVLIQQTSPDKQRYKYDIHYQKKYRSLDQSDPINVLIPHHGAPFASTRWTNLFFPHRMGIFGDIVGGSLAESFGKGILDIPVYPSNDAFIYRTLYSHICYWKNGGTIPAERNNKEFEKDCLVALRSAMRLESLRSKEEWPKPTQLREQST